MISDDVLERGLAAAADEYAVPAGATERVRDELAPRVEERTAKRRWRPSRLPWGAVALAAAVAIIALPIALGGGGSDSGGESAGGTSAGRPAAAEGGDELSRKARTFAPVTDTPALPSVTAPTPVPAGAVPGARAGSTPQVKQRVVKTGQLDLQVPKGQVDATLSRLNSLANLERGYIAESHTSQGGSAPTGTVTLRVPVDRFEDAINRAKSYGTKVLSVQTSGQDVTSKYVDLAARIKALKATRETFLTLLSKATTIGETLSVQQHVTDVQTQIEQLQGQLRVLANKSALSTLTITVNQPFEALSIEQHHESGMKQAFDRSVDRFVNGIEAIVGALGPLLLAALLIGLGWVVVRLAYRRLRRNLV